MLLKEKSNKHLITHIYQNFITYLIIHIIFCPIDHFHMSNHDNWENKVYISISSGTCYQLNLNLIGLMLIIMLECKLQGVFEQMSDFPMSVLMLFFSFYTTIVDTDLLPTICKLHKCNFCRVKELRKLTPVCFLK